MTNVIRKLKDNAAKTGNDAVKTPSQRIVQKTAEVAWQFNGKQIADKVTSVNKKTPQMK